MSEFNLGILKDLTRLTDHNRSQNRNHTLDPVDIEQMVSTEEVKLVSKRHNLMHDPPDNNFRLCCHPRLEHVENK